MTAVILREGPWQRALADVAMVDALITDPPYGARTHGGQRHGRRHSGTHTPRKLGPMITTTGLGYAATSGADAAALVAAWAPRVRGWICIFASHDLIPAYVGALEAAGRYVFAPLACVQRGMNVRLAGDGPSNWTVWLVVSRPRSLHKWGTLPGAYVGTPDRRHAHRIPGGKPLWLMRDVVRHYSRPNDIVCDPFAGSGTTLVAAAMEGRRAIGAELDAATFDRAAARLRAHAAGVAA